MPTFQIPGFGWLPDIPDRRDKMFARAVEHQKNPKPTTRTGQAPIQAKLAPPGADPQERPKPKHTYEGWQVSADRSAEIAANLADPRDSSDLRQERRFQDAFKAAFAGQPRNAVLLATPQGEAALPPSVDLRPFMSPIEDQQSLGSCTAQAVVGLVEYLQIVTQGVYIDGSRLFLYKATRDLLELTGDTGAFIRETIKAMAIFGVCPERYLPYDVETFDAEPSPFCYSFAGNYKAVSYYRLANLTEIRQSLDQGYPVAFGFTCYESLDDPAVAQTGIIPYPVAKERSVGGHAVLAVGYIDQPEWYPEGVLIIRNSWGTRWGQEGYGFLPYSYIQGNDRDRDPASDDYWTMVAMDFTDLPDVQAPPYAMGTGPALVGRDGTPPLVRHRALARPGREAVRSGNRPFRGVNPVFKGGNPVFRGPNPVFKGGNPVFRGGNPVFATAPARALDTDPTATDVPLSPDAFPAVWERLGCGDTSVPTGSTKAAGGVGPAGGGPSGDRGQPSQTPKRARAKREGEGKDGGK